MRVRRLAIVDDAMAEQLWQRYRQAFAPLVTEAAHRQRLHREEFLEEMRESRIWKYVGLDPDEGAVSLVTLTRHLETMQWVSPEYFAARWPREYEEGRVYYMGLAFLSDGTRRRGQFKEVIQAVVKTIADAQGVVGFDICQFNQQMRDVLLAGVRKVASQNVPDVATVDSQTYFAVSFRAPDGNPPTRDGEVIDLTNAGSGLPNK